jgi:excisionase family DNA binding protein
MEKLLTLEEAAEALGTPPRFPRRLVAERRIRFVKVGKYVRIPESAIEAFVQDGTVEVVVRRPRGWAS